MRWHVKPVNFKCQVVVKSGPNKYIFVYFFSNLYKMMDEENMKQESVAVIKSKFKLYSSGAKLIMEPIPILEEDLSVDECDSKHLLMRNTESFTCLRQLVISSSSITKNRLFLFPPLEDPGITATFNFEDPTPDIDDIGVEAYKRMCKEMEIVPISRVIKSLATDTLDLKYYGLTSKQFKALTETLKPNSRVTNLILEDNWLNVEMVSMLCDTIVENTALHYLSLRECRIGEEGAEKLGKVLASLQSIKSLDLSFNDIGDHGLLHLQNGLSENMSLKKLNISHNNLTEASGEALEKILMANKYIEDIDLSWSGFFTTQCNKRLFNALTRSNRIKVLNLAWNGIGDPQAARPISRYIRATDTLEELDLSNNRLVDESLGVIRGAILKNRSLKIVRIGNNIYTPDDAHSLLTVLVSKGKDPEDPLKVLDMENMYINKTSKPVLLKIIATGKTVKLGGILSDYEIKGPNVHKLIYDRCRYILMKPKRKKAKKDFGHFILSLPDIPIIPDEFFKVMKKLKIKKLDDALVKGLMDLYPTKNHEINCPELVKDYMSLYPETELPPAKPKKQKKAKASKKQKKPEEELMVHDLENAPTTDEADNKEENYNQSQLNLPATSPSDQRFQQHSRLNANFSKQHVSNMDPPAHQSMTNVDPSVNRSKVEIIAKSNTELNNQAE
ncbi:uncharacterized protein LOC115883011 [Sitophilus oryzae]|uniref:Uncharacterized protein LOC115883011 n=1 Tax=Sitophilus oryzae TaxID=7048 RepID=A0A6J2Y078_SITOR|nr:uncharacterized protein LOC115883011 [Sitophilus oryzae]